MRPIVLLQTIVLLAASVVGSALAATPAWDGWAPATCMPAGCFCEALAEQTIRQPVNTWSSFAFVLAAVWVAWLTWQDKREASSSGRPLPTLFLGTGFALALSVVGLGSAFYHASLTLAGQFVDVLGMYLVITLLIGHSLAQRYALSSGALLSIYLIANLLLATLLWLVPEARRYAFALLVLVFLATEQLRRKTGCGHADSRWLVAAIATLAAAFVIWIADIRGWLCAPESLVQGHAFWHLLGSLSAVMIFAYYRSEALPGKAARLIP
jgi:hypothetical protein